MVVIVPKKTPDHILTLGEQHVAESLQGERGDVDEIHHGEGDVRRDFISDWFVVQQMCDSPVARGDRRDNTQGDLEAQPLRVDVVRFAVVVVVHLAHDGMVVSLCSKNGSVVAPDEAKA